MRKGIKILALYGVSCCLFAISCKDETITMPKNEEVENTVLFTDVPSSQSGIHFVNEIPESSAMNSMVYEYFYNGGGVAIGDIDNDGLADIYLTSNLKDNKLYRNKGDFQFEDITEKAGVKGTFGWTTGTTMADVNADGWLDIYVCKSGKGKAQNRENLLFLNNKNGTFTEVAQAYNLNFSGYSTQASFFDYDKDGDLDMFLLNHNVTPINTNNPENFKEEENELSGDRLYRNDSGKFVNVSKESGIIGNSLGFGLGVSVGDLNQDGWPDIYVANDYVEQDYLYYNNGDGTFSEQLKTAIPHTSNFSMGTDMADFNNDGLLDIMSLDMVAEDNYGIKTSMSGMDPQAFNHAVDHGFHYQYMFNALQMNHGNGTFGDIAHLAGVSNTDWSWGPLFGDFDNDGLKDIVVTNGLKRDFRNNDFRKYKLERLEEAQKNGEKIPKVIEELVRKTPQRKTKNYFFKNNGDLTFTNTGKAWGISKNTFSNGAAYGDLDNDGDLDLIINNVDEEATVLKNNTKKNYLQFWFKGSSKNPFGVGVRVEVQAENSSQYVENYPTRGYQSAVAPILHVGLDTLVMAKTIKIIWPDGKMQSLNNVAANQRLLVDYKNAIAPKVMPKEANRHTFKDITKDWSISHKHEENHFDDFKKESLLPHKMSQFGPALAVGDVNNDGLEDFFVGGAKGFPAALYLQNRDRSFVSTNLITWHNDKEYEDVDAVFLDVDNDKDLDLYVVSGGNEWPTNHLQYRDRLYINNNGVFTRENKRLPKLNLSGSCVKPFDFDKDGDLDLFVGSRLFPQKYPHSESSRLLENVNGIYTDVTDTKAPEMEDLGMVTDALWTDFDTDGQTDLIVVGEWTKIVFFRNQNGTLINDPSILSETQGWWNSIEEEDMDNDGDMDYIIGNLGLNYKYKASAEEPFEVYSTDFDDNGTNDIVLGYYNQGDLFPLRGRECSSQQMPFLKKKFPTYDSFGSANLVQVYGREKLQEALHLQANIFASVYLENLGHGTFTLHILPNEAQTSAINDIYVDDFDGNGFKDILVAGNLYQSEVETPRSDASIGMLLKGNGNAQFTPASYGESGFALDGDVKKIRSITLGPNGDTAILVARNDNDLKLIALSIH
ncbi:VCBS repeat-containing protein [Spongiimicrobium sp. 3-5]|uniref:VCBS repeat-containing protein n=1 Tax=Spongiimicrobium sp. 3-5 TaxID=3332596 RepID=UPI00397EE595